MRKAVILSLIGLGGWFSAGSISFGQSLVIGNWSNDTSDGWIDWATQSSYSGGATSLPSPEYTYSTPTGSNPGSDDLLLTESGFAQDLAIKLEYVTGGIAAFEANQAIQFTISVPASSAGYTQIYEVALNAPTWGFKALTADPVPASDFSPASNFAVGTSGLVTYTMTVPYTTALATIGSSPSYVEFILETNNGGGASDEYYFDSAALVPVPEPATGSLALAAIALPLFKRRRRVAE